MRASIATMLIVFTFALPAAAAVPPTMNFQGILTNATGGVVPDGPYSVTFAIYNSASAGAALWSEVQTISTSSGLFNVVLGAAVPIPDTAFMDSAAYLELTVATDPPLSPRTPLTSNAYSVVTSSLIGGGPVQMEKYDPSSGALGSAALTMEQSAATSGRVKVRFHWDSHYPATGDSSIYDFVAGPDSTYESKRMHKPFQILKTIDKASPLMSELSIVSTSGSADSAVYTRSVSTTDGFLETNTSTSPTAQATGKRQHRPITFTKEWGAVSSSRSFASSAISTLDSGYTRNIVLNEGDVTVEMQQQLNYPDVVTAKSRPFVFPHILEKRKSAKGSSGDTAETRFFVDADSGYATRIAVHQGDESMESLDLIGAPPMGAIAIPNLLEARKGANETTGDTASTWNFVDVDSGCGETATLLSSGGSTRFSRIVKAPSGSISPGGPSTVFSLGMETQTTSAGGGHAQEVLDIVAGYTKTAGLTKTDLITSAETGTSQTREHILLSRQVGVPGATAEKSIAFQTDNSGATATLQRGNATDSTGIEMFAADDSTRLVLYTRTGAARYSNITLKRGVVGAELSLGYDFASPSGMLYAVSSPAAGAQLGINTNTPSTAFHLVGNGCYTGTFGACSDARYKENVETLSHSLNLVRRLRGVRFDWKRSDYPENHFPAGEQVGLIAQEVEAVVPAVVNTGADGYKSVDYAKLVSVLIEGMKEQQEQIGAQQDRIDKLEQRIRDLEREM